MFVNDKLKLNKFRLVAIPKPRNLFYRFGVTSMPVKQYSGDNPAVITCRKIDSIADMDNIDSYQFRQEENLRLAKEREAALDNEQQNEV